VSGQGRQGAVRRARLAAATAEVRELVARLAAGDPALAGPDLGAADPDPALTVPDLEVADVVSEREVARQLVRLLRSGLLAGPGAADAAGQGILAAGDAVAGVYGALVRGGQLPPGWMADVQVRGGLWVRPQAGVAAERALVNNLTGSPAVGLLVVGTARRPTTAEARQAQSVAYAVWRAGAADMSGLIVAWWGEVSVPGSWEDQNGRALIGRAHATGAAGGFVMGLGAGQEGELAVYGEEGRGFPARRLRRAHLEALGWRRGQAIVVVARHQEADGLGALAEALAEEVGADIWYPAPGASLRLVGEGLLQAVPAASGESASPWRMHASRSLRSSGVEVPAWLTVSDDGVLVPAVPAGGFFWFGFRGGMASVGPAGLPGLLPLMEGEPVPGLLDLVLQRDERGGLGLAGPGGGFIPLSRDNLPALPEGTREARLVADDGEGVRAAAADLAEWLGVPVWVTPAGAELWAEGSQLVAWREGGPVAWVQVLPGGHPAANTGIPPWYDTGRGTIRVRPGPAIAVFSGHRGEVNGIILRSHPLRNSIRAGSHPDPQVPPGLYAVFADIVPGEDGPVFVLPNFDGSEERRSLGELPQLLGRYNWAPGQAILISSDFTGYAGAGTDQDWEALTEGLERLAGAAGASVFFPGRGSRAEHPGREGEPLVLVGGDEPRWLQADPPRWPDEPAPPMFVQDPDGRLWSREPGTGVVSLPLGAGVALWAGGASPAEQMMRAGALGYWQPRGGDASRAVFIVDVPLTVDGGMGLVRDERGPGPDRPATAGLVREEGGVVPAVGLLRAEVVAADAGQVAELIMSAGFQPGGQVIQFLAVPPDDGAYAVFRAQAREVAGLTGGDVYIVGGAGATVAYDAGREAFAARLAAGGPAGWQRLSPPAPGRPPGYDETEGPGRLPGYDETEGPGRLPGYDETEGPGRLPGYDETVGQSPDYFETDEGGVLVRAGRVQEPGTGPELAGPGVGSPGGGLPGSAESSGEERRAFAAGAGARGDGRPSATEPPVLTRSAEGYADVLHGAPEVLAVGDEFAITREALAFDSGERFSGEGHYVIDRPVARALPLLDGAMMFDHGSRFVVTGVSGEEGRRVTRLRHPGSGEGEGDVPPSSGDDLDGPPAEDASGGPAHRHPMLSAAAEPTQATAPAQGATTPSSPAPAVEEPSVESFDADSLRIRPAPAAPAASALPFSAGELAHVMWAARGQELTGAGDGAGSLAACAAVVGGFLRQVYPRLRLARGDDAWGLGGVAGARERLVPGGGWARVGSWNELAVAVAIAGAGTSAVVLASRAGGRQGHALVLHETTDGPRWADPGADDPNGVLTAGLPADVRSAVAAWAVVVDRDGRVVVPPEPGAWAAPESAGGEWMLADPPLRHDFGAMGVEIERHTVRLFRPGGRDLPEKVILLHSSDGMVRVAVDHSQAWLGNDGALYESPEDMRARTGSAAGGWETMAVPEIVTVPWAVTAEPNRPDLEAVQARIRDADWRLNRATRARRSPPEHGSSLAELFPRDSGWVINPRFKTVQVARPEGLSNGAPLYLQVSVGVPLGGGVLAALDELERGTDSGADHAAVLGTAAEFGWQVARHYIADAVRAVPSPDGTGTFTPDWDVADVITVVEVMALAFHQLGAVLDYQATRRGNMKQRIPVAARQSLHEIWNELGPQLQDFFRHRAEVIRGLFEEDFLVLSQGFTDMYNATHGRPEGMPVNLWDLEVSDEYTHERIGSVGGLFDEILRPAPGGVRIGPQAFDVAPADSGGGLDRSGASGPGMPLPLVVLEMRYLGESKYDRPGLRGRIDQPMMTSTIERLTRMAQAGDAAAAFARRLTASREGRRVATRLRQVATTREGPGRDVAGNLREAVEAYLARFPGESVALGMTVGPVAERLGVRGLGRATPAGPHPGAGANPGAGAQPPGPVTSSDAPDAIRQAAPEAVAELTSVADARPDVRTVFLPAEAETVDLRPVRDMLWRERHLGALPGGRGRPRRPVRVVVARMPDGMLGQAVLGRLRGEFAATGREAFAPAPGNRVVIRDGDLAVTDSHGQPGRWVEVGSARPTRRLGYGTLDNGHLGLT
jgi:hypothetical protein